MIARTMTARRKGRRGNAVGVHYFRHAPACALRHQAGASQAASRNDMKTLSQCDDPTSACTGARHVSPMTTPSTHSPAMYQAGAMTRP